jgi:hypothetical protein
MPLPVKILTTTQCPVIPTPEPTELYPKIDLNQGAAAIVSKREST